MNAGMPIVNPPTYVMWRGRYGNGICVNTTPNEISAEYTVFTRNRLATRSILAMT